MSINTYVALDQVTLGSNTGPIVFTNIPQGYTDLRIVIKGGFVDSGFLIGARVGNGSVDTGANYSYQLFRGSYAGTPSAYRKSGMVFGAFCQQGGNNLDNVITVDFFNYSNTTTFKTWSSRYSNPSEGADACVSLWRSTAAINTISIAECGDGGSGTFNYGNMLSGTTVSLYGIKAWANTESTPKATGGWVTSDANYWYHTFPFSSTFTPNQSLTCDYLVVAGGGASGYRTANDYYYCGGGGGGGLLTSVGSSGGGAAAGSALSLTAQAYTITVGAGGAAPASNGNGSNGSNSSISTLITAIGGGGGALTGANGLAGGSGGGAGSDSYTQFYGGAGTSGQGYAGGNMETGNALAPGGGGGAGGVGGNGGAVSSGKGGTGGAALANSITGTSIYYAGGGAGGRGYYGSALLGNDGTGYALATSARGMGGRPDSATNASGGSGIVIIRYAK